MAKEIVVNYSDPISYSDSEGSYMAISLDAMLHKVLMDFVHCFLLSCALARVV